LREQLQTPSDEFAQCAIRNTFQLSRFTLYTTETDSPTFPD
jgi:hypothetical protein